MRLAIRICICLCISITAQAQDKAAVAGLMWHDLNGNGSPDSGEPLLSGWTVFSDDNRNGIPDPTEVFATTDASGSFMLLLDPGTVRIREVIQPGWAATRPAYTGYSDLTLVANQGEEVWFGNIGASAVSGTKWADTNGDSTLNTGEAGVDDWTFFLDGTSRNATAVRDSVTSDNAGAYMFDRLPPGTYTITEEQRSGWRLSFPASGSYVVTISDSGQFIEERNFGNIPPGYPTGSLMGLHFFDRNKNGSQDAMEPGLTGFTIILRDSAGVVLDSVLTGQMDRNADSVLNIFNESGVFVFTDVPAGPYTLEKRSREGWEQTFPQSPGTHIVVLQPSQNMEGLDFGSSTLQFFDEDWGDLPHPAPGLPPGAGFYEPAGHLMQGPFLGDVVDKDPLGAMQQDLTATADDANNPVNDEDGVRFVTFGSENGTVQVKVSGPPDVFVSPGVVLNAWFDFSEGYVLGVPLDEHILEDVPVPLAARGVWQEYTFKMPRAELIRGGYARFRVGTKGSGSEFSRGLATDGEVEDYWAFGLDYGDAPDRIDPQHPAFPGGYPTLLNDDGARHAIASMIRLGESIIDGESNGIPSIWANGDDVDNLSDEDGILFEDGFTVLYNGPDPDNPNRVLTLYGITLGVASKVTPLPSVSGKLTCWMDWNRNDVFDETEEKVIDDEDVDSGPDYVPFWIALPMYAKTGWTYQRFRFSTRGQLTANGPAIDGEVEDYVIAVLPVIDWGDAPPPYTTLARDGGARHIVGEYHLGARVDGELDAQQDANAEGDDLLDGNDDEDGVAFPSPLEIGRSGTCEITVATPLGLTGYLSAWMDFNHDGDWQDEGECIVADTTLTEGQHSLGFNIPDEAIDGTTFARFRFDERGSRGPTDPPVTDSLSFTVGEVEDYQVNIVSVSGIRGDADRKEPEEFYMYPAHPNPVRDVGSVRYDLFTPSVVRLDVLNILGQSIATLADGARQAGSHTVRFSLEAVPSGIYFLRIDVNGKAGIRKFVVYNGR